MPARILVIDDELGMQIALKEVLQRQGYEVTLAADGMQALELLESVSFDLALSDVRMPEMSGIQLLGHVCSRWPKMPVIIITAHGTIEDAVQAMKSGAADYLLKPFSSEAVEEAVSRQLEIFKRSTSETANTSGGGSEPKSTRRVQNGRDPIAVSEAMRHVLELAEEVADSTATILIEGDSGTGKEVVARYIHQHSNRNGEPFVAINCAALPEGLLESELFGHEKGAFTGAVLSRKGKFEMANHGTLLLDEISEMPLALQAKLLRVLQEKEIDPVGSQRTISLDVRVIATTNRNLAEYVEEGNFREDLFYRLQVIDISLPPLCQRREDILPLAENFVRRHCRANHRPLKRLGNEMRRFLIEQTWRGNVRELENFLERAVLLCKSDEINPDQLYLAPRSNSFRTSTLPDLYRSTRDRLDVAKPSGSSISSLMQVSNSANSDRGMSTKAALVRHDPVDHVMGNILAPGELVTLEEMERRMIMKTLDQVSGNRTRAADLLGVSVRTIRNKLNLYNKNDTARNETSTAL